MMGQYLGVLLVTDISSLVTAHFTTKAASLLITAGGRGREFVSCQPRVTLKLLQRLLEAEY